MKPTKTTKTTRTMETMEKMRFVLRVQNETEWTTTEKKPRHPFARKRDDKITKLTAEHVTFTVDARGTMDNPNISGAEFAEKLRDALCKMGFDAEMGFDFQNDRTVENTVFVFVRHWYGTGADDYELNTYVTPKMTAVVSCRADSWCAVPAYMGRFNTSNVDYDAHNGEMPNALGVCIGYA